MHVEIRDGALVGVELQIYEPPRFYEAFLRGRRHTEPPDLTARICGICPVAYQMSACEAIEDACGVVVDGPLRDLRRLLYCGEWIESHTLHVYLLHAPDFLGYHGAIEMAADHREAVEAGLDSAIVHAARIMPLNKIPDEQRQVCLDLVHDRRGTAGGTGDDDFCWETADVLDNFPGLSPNDYNATNMGSDERFGPT